MFELNPFATQLLRYYQDAFERSVLFLDVLRQRGNDYLAQSGRTAPHVLNFEFKLLIDGRTLPKPVNYALVEIAAVCYGAARSARGRARGGDDRRRHRARPTWPVIVLRRWAKCTTTQLTCACSRRG
jgi:hypothetical protein